jgi:iron complex outermembrane receptor protein
MPRRPLRHFFAPPGSSAIRHGHAAASKAAAAASTQSSFKATQPQSIVNRSLLEEAELPSSDFSSIAVIAPSVTLGISANGPGLGETKNGIRGFKDGEFNITFAGVPFGDTVLLELNSAH